MRRQSNPPPAPQVDIFFVLDVTASMQPAIDGVSDGITSFADGLGKQGLDVRVGLLGFRDRQHDPKQDQEELLVIGGEALTKEYEKFSKQVGRLRARGGGDPAESSLEALATASEQPFRKDAVRVVVLITDESPHIPDTFQRRPADVGKILKERHIDQLHLVIERKDRETYEEIQKIVGAGGYFSLGQAAAGRSNYDTLLPQIGQQIAETAREKQPAARSLQSTQDYTPASGARLLIAIAVWTALLAAGIALALIVGQNHYLKRNLLAQVEGVRGGLGAAACGLLAGFVGQGLFQLADTDSSFVLGLLRLVGWSLLGALLGTGMSFFVKNLRMEFAAAGGAVGGLIGALFFMIASALFGDVLGRLLGSFLLGFGIGAMVALVEMAFRTAWLEVRYGPREVISVNLGPEPVKIGGDGKACTVWARGAAPLAYRFWIREGRIVCEDVANGGTREVGSGTRYSVGAIEVIVRTGQGEERTSDPLPAPPPLPEAQPVKPASLPSNPRELLPPSPPKPVVDTKATPAPVSQPKVQSKVETPIERKVVSAPSTSPPPPPPPPAPPPQEKPPAAPKPTVESNCCPSCGRKVPGLTGQRYCMVCDHTF
jgi:von Willebrand factor type A domain